MKKLIFLITIALSFPSYAQTLYVTDQLDIMVRSGQSPSHRIIGTLKSGKSVRVIESNPSGYSKVAYGNNKQGWVLTRLLSKSKAAKARLASAESTLSKLNVKHKATLEELTALKKEKANLDQQTTKLTTKSNSTARELDTLKRTSANAVQILGERNQLQERVVSIERELETLKRENNTLKSSSAQDWFLVGAGVLALGLLLGFILPKISWRKKSSWSSNF